MHGTQTVDGRDWLPYQRGTFLTPACAEYVSGHSTFVAYRAGADAPASDLLFWPTSSAAADQAAVHADLAAFTSVMAISRTARWDGTSRRSSGERRSAFLRALWLHSGASSPYTSPTHYSYLVSAFRRRAGGLS